MTFPVSHPKKNALKACTVGDEIRRAAIPRSPSPRSGWPPSRVGRRVQMIERSSGAISSEQNYAIPKTAWCADTSRKGNKERPPPIAETIFTPSIIWVVSGRCWTILSKSGLSFRFLGDGHNGWALFHRDQFEIVSPKMPPTWIMFCGPKSLIKLAPEPWTHPGFWERYYNQDRDAIAIFEQERKKIVEFDP
jgi:hypothetical protein